ncbi:hypothetical protein AB6A40_004154 [Gnathostoma spinigerum]|uniref:RRM domain-containing protein n=1 Tax=Gnathostoma spinigerum TaxID=75299 RepID=A0ABD6EMD5_9BILA
MSRRGYRDGDDVPTLYVRQVPYSARPDDLRVLFEKMGTVRDVYIPLDYYTRESRGFAYVKYDDPRDAEDAFKELNGAEVLGRRIEIEWAEGERKTKSEMRKQYATGYYRGSGGRSYSRRRSPYYGGSNRSHRYSYRDRSRSRSPRRRVRNRTRSPPSERSPSRSRSRSAYRSEESRSSSRSRSSVRSQSKHNRVSAGNDNAAAAENKLSSPEVTEKVDETVDVLEERSEYGGSDTEAISEVVRSHSKDEEAAEKVGDSAHD